MAEQDRVQGLTAQEKNQDCGCGCGGGLCGAAKSDCGCGCGGDRGTNQENLVWWVQPNSLRSGSRWPDSVRAAARVSLS